MATAKKAAAAAAPKAAATKAAAKPAAKAAPVKTATAAAAETVAKPAGRAKAAPKVPTVAAVGVIVEFLGYPEATAPEDRVIPDGTRAPIIEIMAADDTNPEAFVIRFGNPGFDEAQPEDPELNPPFIETEVYEGEFAISADQTPVDAEAAPAETPAAEPVKSGRAKATTKAAVAVAPEAQPASDELPELTQEDANVLALIEGADGIEGGLTGIAQSLETAIESQTYQLGGVLYHIKRDGGFKDLDPAFAENKGFEAYVNAYFGFSYRKAMNLIEIYVAFNQLNIENAAEVVAELGWTKASKLAGAMDDENAQDMIELARNNTVEGLSEAIRVQKVEVGGTPGEKKVRATIRLKYWEDEANDITETLNSVKEKQGLKTTEDAFSFIITEFKLAQGEAAPVAEAPKQGAGRAAATSAKPAARRAQAAA